MMISFQSLFIQIYHGMELPTTKASKKWNTTCLQRWSHVFIIFCPCIFMVIISEIFHCQTQPLIMSLIITGHWIIKRHFVISRPTQLAYGWIPVLNNTYYFMAPGWTHFSQEVLFNPVVKVETILDQEGNLCKLRCRKFRFWGRPYLTPLKK